MHGFITKFMVAQVEIPVYFDRLQHTHYKELRLMKQCVLYIIYCNLQEIFLLRKTHQLILPVCQAGCVIYNLFYEF